MLWFLDYWKEILFTVVALRGAYAFYRDMMNKATAAQMPTSVIAPPTLLDEICRECLVNVPADRMEKARVVVAEYEVQIAPKSGKKFHFDEQCHAVALWARPWIEALPVPASAFRVAHRRVLANSFRSNEIPFDVDVSEHISCDVWAVFLFGFIGYDSWVHRLLYLRYATESLA